MSRIVWSSVGERYYEAGVDRGVLYILGSNGVVWNGLTSVSESPSGGDAKSYYLDGIKYLNRSRSTEFDATIEAYMYPDEFAQCDGTTRVLNGLSVTQQSRKSFGLSYRTKIGNDVDGLNHAYKIHLIYNVLASPTEQQHETLTDDPDIFNFSWNVTSKAPSVVGYKPTAHFIVSSKDTPTALLTEIENILYGTVGFPARLPDAQELVSIFETYNGAIDGGLYNSPVYATIDGGDPPSTVQTSTLDGGTP